MIVWDIDTNGDLAVWFYDADPSEDPPHQTVPYDGGFRFQRKSDGDYIAPVDVKKTACWEEVTAEFTANNEVTFRIVRILADAALERIERRTPE